MLEMLWLCISILWRQFFLNLCSKLSSVILLSYKKSHWFYFLYKPSLRFPQTIAVFSRQNIELATQSSSNKSLLTNFAKFVKHLFQNFLFNNAADWKSSTLFKGTPADAILWILRNFHENLFCETSPNGSF